MNNDCTIIQDLMPLYIDKTASKQTENLVKEHLSYCKSCRDFYRECKEENILSTNNPLEKEEIPEPDFSRISMKISKERRFEILVTTAALVIAAAVVIYDIIKMLKSEKEKVHDKSCI